MIVNRHELERFHSDSISRLTLSAFETAIQTVKPEPLVKRAVKVKNSQLILRDIHDNVRRFARFQNVYVVGAGKAAAGMAQGLYSVLGRKVTAGAITVPYGTKTEIERFYVTQASHPEPDKAGIKGTKKILSILKKTDENDLVFVLISGGGSALMPLPAPGVSLADKQKITTSLLRSGASIYELNAVRKHLSSIKGGQLLRYVNESCRVISLILSDVMGDDLAVVASGPTCPDSSTFLDALRILKKYHIETPARATKFISKGVEGKIAETPKPYGREFLQVHNMLIGNNAMACKAATYYLKKQGVNAVYLGSEFGGEAKGFGAYLAQVASRIRRKRIAIVAGGETTVRLDKHRNGLGGRNQEAALACLARLAREDIVVGCIGTDGIDGNSDAAGALISPKTITLARKMNLQKHLDMHDSYHALKKLHSLIFTGYTGTNVNDVSICMS